LTYFPVHQRSATEVCQHPKLLYHACTQPAGCDDSDWLAINRKVYHLAASDARVKSQAVEAAQLCCSIKADRSVLRHTFGCLFHVSCLILFVCSVLRVRIKIIIGSPTVPTIPTAFKQLQASFWIHHGEIETMNIRLYFVYT